MPSYLCIRAFRSGRLWKPGDIIPGRRFTSPHIHVRRKRVIQLGSDGGMESGPAIVSLKADQVLDIIRAVDDLDLLCDIGEAEVGRGRKARKTVVAACKAKINAIEAAQEAAALEAEEAAQTAAGTEEPDSLDDLLDEVEATIEEEPDDDTDDDEVEDDEEPDEDDDFEDEEDDDLGE